MRCLRRFFQIDTKAFNRLIAERNEHSVAGADVVSVVTIFKNPVRFAAQNIDDHIDVHPLPLRKTKYDANHG